MKYGLVGESLKHSFSPEIHSKIADYEYEIREIKRDDIDGFFRQADFLGINITIPYKETVIPYLDEIDCHAARIGAVNTVIKKDGRLIGFNTDFYGMLALIEHSGISISKKQVVILGTGGTAKTARAVCEHLGAAEIFSLARRAGVGDGLISEAAIRFSSAEVIINTTPVGMFPNIYDTPIGLDGFTRLSGVIDVIYNPICTPLVLAARKLGIPAIGGLYMLVAQAVFASEIFLGGKSDDGLLDAVYEKIKREKESIVLIGMPSSGKTTVGRELAARLKRHFIDTDEVICEITGRKIPDIITELGEDSFRDIESEAVRRAAGSVGAVIATGGGAVLREENLMALRENGRIFFLDRPLSSLTPTIDRPLSRDRDALALRYAERYPIYNSVCDERIDASGDAQSVVTQIIDKFCK